MGSVNSFLQEVTLRQGPSEEEEEQQIPVEESEKDGDELLTLLPQVQPKRSIVTLRNKESVLVYTTDNVTEYKNAEGFRVREGRFYFQHVAPIRFKDVTEVCEENLAVAMSKHNCSYGDFVDAFNTSKTVHFCDNNFFLLDSGSYRVKAYTTLFDITFNLTLQLHLTKERGITERRTIRCDGKNIDAVLCINYEYLIYPTLKKDVEGGDVLPITYYIERKPAIDSSLIKPR